MYLMTFVRVIATSDIAGRLVVHVGPHKTANSHTQHFLTITADHLFQQYGIRIAASLNRKAGAYVPNTLMARVDPSSPHQSPYFVDETRCEHILGHVRRWLARGENVILSAEDFTHVAGDGRVWALLAAAVGNTTAITAVFAHRGVLAWARSLWVESNKQKANPQSFADFALSKLSGGSGKLYAPASETAPVLAAQLASTVGAANVRGCLPHVCLNGPMGGVAFLLDRRRNVGLLQVVGFSYDLLVARGSSPASFLVCNATLALAGAAWTACDADVGARMAALPRPNVSPPSEMIDVVRLARLAWLVDCGTEVPNSTSGGPALSAMNLKGVVNSAVRAVAAMLPTTCDSDESLMSALSSTADTEWPREAGIFTIPPRARSEKKDGSSLCVVDELRLTPAHLSSIRSLLPACAGTRQREVLVSALAGRPSCRIRAAFSVGLRKLSLAVHRTQVASFQTT